MKILLLALITFFSLSSIAEVYTWINDKGIRVYGDEPPANAKKAQLPRLQTIPNKKKAADKPVIKVVEQPSIRADKPVEKQFQGYRKIAIITPKKDEVILAGQAGNATVRVQIEPPLEIGHEITLLMDGKQVGKGPQMQFDLENIYRGSHLLQVKIKHKGQLLISSPKRRIHVQRPSILGR